MKTIIKQFLAAVLPVAVALTAGAQQKDAAGGDYYQRMSGNLMAYPYTETPPPPQTPAPDGYEAFHLEHYGRHGSRWLIGADDYLTPVRRLESAERNGKLTPLGEEVLAALREIQKASVKREGELSDKGAIQHQAIARRMVENYPAIFSDGASLDARSTVVIRCILSMLNGVETIKGMAPGVNVHTDASYADMRYMNYADKPAWKVKDEADATALADYKRRHAPKGDWLGKLVSDPEFARDSVEPGILPYLYWVLANAQSHTGQPWLLDRVFSPEEVKELWRQGNAGWFVHSGNSALTRGRMPYTQRNLLRNIIESADTAIMSAVPGANLRYGHDGILVNAVTLMELDRYGERIDDLEELEALGWHDYDLIPKAGNLQIVFYRRPEAAASHSGALPDDVLVKVLLNEREVTLPLEPVSGPYYSWPTVRAYYLDKLDRFDRSAKEK